MRSRIGPDTRDWYFWILESEQRQERFGSVRKPHGHTCGQSRQLSPGDEFAYTLTIKIPKSWEKPSLLRSVGGHIRRARLKRGLQIKELASQLGVSPSSVTNWEKHKVRPDYPLIRKLKALFPELALVSPGLIYHDYPKEPQTFGQRLKKKRLELDLSQRELALKLGVCLDAVADWEAGRTRAQDASFESGMLQKLQIMCG